VFGSMVQKGKFSAGMPIFVITLKSVLFPTLGSPTIPICGQTYAQRSQSVTATAVRANCFPCFPSLLETSQVQHFIARNS
jgi:hypothetical protein